MEFWSGGVLGEKMPLSASLHHSITPIYRYFIDDRTLTFAQRRHPSKINLL
jgi:hypothetical protein